LPTASNPATQSPMPASSSRIPELDGLRGLAILLVILCHYVGNADHVRLGWWIHRPLSAFTIGWSGVDLFFVLSGFLIGGILLDARTSPHYFRAFYMRRVFRILPLYYAWTLLFGILVVLALWLAPGRTPLSSRDLLQVPLHLLFLQDFRIGMLPWPWIWFVVTWSLAVEEQFYLLAPFLIRYVSIRKLVAVLATIIAVAPFLRLVVYRWTGNPFSASIPMPCRADALAWGILLAVAWRQPSFRNFLANRGSVLSRTVLFLFLGVVALSWWLAHPPALVTLTIGMSWLAVFYTCLLLLVLFRTGSNVAAVMRWRWLGKLGTISYCVYILHDTFNQIAHRLLLHSEPQLYDLRGLAVTLLALVLTLSVASLSWRYFERPLIRRGHRYSYGESTSANSSTWGQLQGPQLPASGAAVLVMLLGGLLFFQRMEGTIADRV
jgi:peptidoglycan/LPS O-acetylase OafA/YrhL